MIADCRLPIADLSEAYSDFSNPSEDAGILNEGLMKLAYGGEDVDSFDEPNGSENTVSNQVRRLTSQWGNPMGIVNPQSAIRNPQS